eukprot:CAMPEP_0171775804 /NCGR_PEP_ID=MMETSP0991-20121206/56736_1 /TAXON_ID=483369 /ORGANISM="non described non described, Strain CCMP2098" /LENGTH=384 /DNA_ID=CAMNT_0012382061 /DNA_START=115 /DNA_END=1269 /DNA_ORIENTATION=+
MSVSDLLVFARKMIDAAEATLEKFIARYAEEVDTSCGFRAGNAWLKRVIFGFKVFAGIEVREQTLNEESLLQTIVVETGPDGMLANSQSLKEVRDMLMLFEFHCNKANINANFLKHLVVRNQAVETLSSLLYLSNYACLTRLDLHGNKLTFLPPSFADSLPNIEILNLCNNQLSKLPRFLDQRDKLKPETSFEIEEIFQECGYPEQFRQEGLAMSVDAKFRRRWAAFDAIALQSTFVKMPQLKVLWLNGNPLISLPHELASLPLLTDLSIAGCDQLPATLQGALSARRWLGFAERTRRAREWLVFDGLALAAVRRCVNLVLVVWKNLPSALSRLVHEFMIPSVGLEVGHPLHRSLSLVPSFRGGRVLRSGRLVESRKRKMWEAL